MAGADIEVKPTSEAAVQSEFSMKKVGQQTLIYGGGILGAKLVAIVMLPLYTTYLGLADYGIIALVEMAFDVLTIVAGARIAAGVFRFYHKSKLEPEKHAVMSTAFLLITALYGLVAVAAYMNATGLSRIVFRGDESKAVLFQIAAVTFVFQGASLVPMAYLRVREQAKQYVLSDVGKLLLQMSLNVYFLVYAGMGLEGIFISNLISSGARSIVLSLYMLHIVKLRYSLAASRDLVRFGIPLIFTQIATFLVTFGDRWFLRRSWDDGEVGLYSFAYQFGFMLYALGCAPYQMIWDPTRYQVVERDDRDAVLSRGFIHMNYLLMCAALVIGLFAQDLVRVLARQPEYYVSYKLVPLILVPYVLLSWSTIQDIGVLVREKTEYLTLANWLAALAALVGYLTLVPAFGAEGAAFTAMFSFSVRYFSIYYFSQKVYPIRYEWGPVLRLSALTAAWIAAGMMIDIASVVASVMLRTVMAAFWLLAVWNSRILAEREKQLVLRVLKNPRVIAGGWRG